MELKAYDKPWLPAIKGALLILTGIFFIVQIVGSIKSLTILFIVLIGAMGASLIASGLHLKKHKTELWPVVTGVLNLAFALFLLLNINSGRFQLLWIIFAWIIYYACVELVEAGILASRRNAFAALFVINALLSFMFSYFLSVVRGNFTSQTVFYLGIVAIVFGLVYLLSSYLLSRLRE